jgi:hypothetical protein
MSSPMGQGGRALVLRLVLAEVLAKRAEGPLAPRFVDLLARGTARSMGSLAHGTARPDARPLPEGALLESESAQRGRERT